MAPIYTNIKSHPSISGKAKALLDKDEPAFVQQVMLAETLLKVPESPWTGRSGEQARLAIILQVNWQVEWGMDPYVIDRESARTQNEFRAYKENVPLVNPQAAAIIEPPLVAAGLGPFSRTLRSIRGPNK